MGSRSTIIANGVLERNDNGNIWAFGPDSTINIYAFPLFEEEEEIRDIVFSGLVETFEANE